MRGARLRCSVRAPPGRSAFDVSSGRHRSGDMVKQRERGSVYRRHLVVAHHARAVWSVDRCYLRSLRSDVGAVVHLSLVAAPHSTLGPDTARKA
eukprot:2898697-Rhodomonas_salina.10